MKSDINKKIKKLIIEYSLASAVLITGSFANDRAEEERKESSTEKVIEYTDLYTSVEEGSRLVQNDDGSFSVEEYTLIHKDAPKGYSIDYVKDVAYKTKEVEVYNETAEKIYKYTILRNNILSLAGVILTTTFVNKVDKRKESVKKLLLK